MAKRALARNFPLLLFPEVFPMTAPAISAPAPKGRLGVTSPRQQVWPQWHSVVQPASAQRFALGLARHGPDHAKTRRAVSLYSTIWS